MHREEVSCLCFQRRNYQSYWFRKGWVDENILKLQPGGMALVSISTEGDRTISFIPIDRDMCTEMSCLMDASSSIASQQTVVYCMSSDPTVHSRNRPLSPPNAASSTCRLVFLRNQTICWRDIREKSEERGQ
ncbi:1,4-alpha-glucan-branching enzyme-like protein [Corchorus olitorius]|uniref:1,4-alpha-glucan-branching enzyme-like protein n=1 Tax=Corchorus olitorius TaxID=93759 RepID=A0A1R3HKM7_9ROSI|nr:1,4-alpha-glucan-branching enzyme-like protein [Corchorus olitorius]